VTAFLCKLAEPEIADGTTGGVDSTWSCALRRWGLPAPSTRKIGGISYDLYWPHFQVLAVPGLVPDGLAAACADFGVDLVELPDEPGEAAPTELVVLLGAA
jgi:hypothetical protein